MDKETNIHVEAPVIPIIGLTLQEVAAALRVHPRSVVNLIENDDLPARKVAGGWRIEENALRQWLASGRDKPAKYNLDKDKSKPKKTKPDAKPVIPMRPKKQSSNTEEPKPEPITIRRDKPKQKA